jgi:hypothetical protein
MSKLRIIGLGLMLPMVGLVGYLIVSPKMWLLAAMNVVFTLMAMVGWNLVKGDSVKKALTDTATSVADNVASLTK